MKLSEILKRYREENAISQREFARRCGLSNSLISILERGYNPQTGTAVDPDSRTIRRLASGMGMTEQQLRDLLRASSVVKMPVADYTEADQDRLEALHQDPRLRMLFDRSMRMSDEDKDKMIQIAGVILGELYPDK